jgi:hypothetical protein
VAIVYDVDPAGRAGAARVEAALRGAAESVVVLELPLSGDPEGDGKDLSDFLAISGIDALRSLLADACRPDAGLAGSISTERALADAIDLILMTDAPPRLKRREAAKVVIEDLFKVGQLIQASGNRRFWFDREHHRLLDLDGFLFRSFVIKRYDINAAEPEFRHVWEAIKSACANRGTRAEVYRFAYFDRETCVLFVSAGKGRVVRLDGHTIQWAENGEHGVLFEGNEDQEIIPEASPTSAVTSDPLSDLILSRVNFIRGAGVVLNADQQRLLLRIWLIAVFFPELLPSKVLLLLYGEKGSGKTTTLRVILKLLIGPKANVTPLVNKEDGFNAAVSTEFLLVLDNVDSFSRWIEDRLATVSTGQTIRLRKLYTTNEMLEFPTRCCIALTARTPRFRRDDVVDRLLILRVNRLETFAREAKWYAEIEENRALLWAQLLHDLNRVVAYLRDASVTFPDKIRMADWGFIASTIGEALGQGDAVRQALEAAELDKAHFLLEADDVYELLASIAEDHPEREWKAGELYTDLKRRADQGEIEFNIKSPKSLGRILKRLEPALKLMVRFEVRIDRHDNQARYVLGPFPKVEG